MLAQTILSFALLACGTLAAPTPGTSSTASDLEKRATWQEGKCEASIRVDSKSLPKTGWEWASGTDLYWQLNVIDNPGAQIGSWGAKNPPEKNREVSTSKGLAFVIRGQPGIDKSPDALTLHYGSQVWNSKDCFKYEYEDTDATKGYKRIHQWYCQFDC